MKTITIILLINMCVMFTNIYLVRRDDNWWERHGCINGVINFQKAIPKEFKYKDYDGDRILSKAFDAAADQCDKTKVGL